MPALIATLFLWLLLGSIVYFLNPHLFLVLPIFFFIVFLSSLFTFSLIFVNKRRGLLISIFLTVFLILKYFGIGNVLNFFLILGILVAIEVYFCYR